MVTTLFDLPHQKRFSFFLGISF